MVRNVSWPAIIFLVAYILIFFSFVLYSLVQLWPSAPSIQPVEDASLVTFLDWKFSLSDEVRLILIIALAGALGSLIRVLRSVAWYIGNDALQWSWIVQYIVSPFAGSLLGLVFYFVIRGGFFSLQASPQQTNIFGFVALAGLVGMFTEQAVERLRIVFDSLLAPAPAGRGHVAPSRRPREEDERE